MIYSKRFRVPVLDWIALSSVLGFGFTFWGFGSVPFSSQREANFGHAPRLPEASDACGLEHYDAVFVTASSKVELLSIHPDLEGAPKFVQRGKKFWKRCT